jgi:hypothetical protein
VGTSEDGLMTSGLLDLLFSGKTAEVKTKVSLAAAGCHTISVSSL